MTVTETTPQAPTEPPRLPSQVDAPIPADPSGLAEVIGSGDHKVIGRLYIGCSLLFGLVALAAGLAVSIDRIDGTLGNTILSADTYDQIASFQSTAIVFMLLIPLVLGLAITIVPLQVGSEGIAFPRAAAASFWGWLLGSATFVAAYALNGGPGGGDFNGVALWAGSFVLVVASLLLGTACVVTTVFGLRAEGMSLDRTPLFSWSMLVAGVMWLLTLPILVAVLVLIYVDHRYGQKSFGLDGPEMFGRVFWSLRQPQIYAFAVPLLGLAAEVVPVSAGVRLPQRRVAMGAIGGLAVLSFGAFLQNSIYPKATLQPVYVAMAILAVLPVLALLGGLVGTLRAGRPKLFSPLVFVVPALLLLLLGIVGGAAASIGRFNLQGTQFETGQANLVLFATIAGALGGLFWWGTKIVGGSLPAPLGLLTAGVALLGALLAGLPYAISGAFGNDTDAVTGIEALNVLAVAGYGLMFVALLLAVLALLSGLRAGTDSQANPWSGHTLEWATASPPATPNFAEAPVVASAEPLLDLIDPDQEVRQP